MKPWLHFFFKCSSEKNGGKMAKKYNLEGVQFEDASHNKMAMDYQCSDIETVFRQSDWQNWDDIINWLRDTGVEHRGLTPGEIVTMADDLSRLKQERVPFTRDSHRVFEITHKYRGNSNVA
jgi:hypothetical protein